MRRTITTLMFLAVGGLAFALQAAEPGQASGNWNYYAAGLSRYRISDDDESAAASGTEQSNVSTAVGQPDTASEDKKAVYLTEKTASAGELLQTNYFAGGGDGCCQSACGCDNNCSGNSCLSNCCDCNCTINSFRFELLGWFSRGRSTPPLVTTNPDGTPSGSAGALDVGSTSILYGNDPIGGGIRTGGRVTFSHLFRDNITSGTVRFWGVEDKSEDFVTNSTQRSIIAQPFFNVLLGQQDAFLVAYPGITDPGSIRVLSKNDLIGADAWLSRNWYDDGCSSIDVLGGYQFTRLDDSLTINSSTVLVDPVAVGSGLDPNTAIGIFDSFRTQNEFHGGSMGVIARSYRGNVTLEGLFKVALGSMRQAVIVDGNTTITPPGGVAANTAGGLLAQPTNIGSQQTHRFAFSPELNLNVLYNLDSNWRLIGGYSFIYWNSVVLAGNQIDTRVNPSQFTGGGIVGALAPQPKFQRTDFWVQGINLGAEYNW